MMMRLMQPKIGTVLYVEHSEHLFIYYNLYIILIEYIDLAQA